MPCRFCGEGDSGANSGHSVCRTCHNFLFDMYTDDTDPHGSGGSGSLSHGKNVSDDSGNDECSDSERSSHQASSSSSATCRCRAYRVSEDVKQTLALPISSPTVSSSSRTRLLANVCQPLPSLLLDMLPFDIILHILRYMNDLDLWSLRQVSERLMLIIDSEISDVQWWRSIQRRWPLFQAQQNCNSSGRLLYCNLMGSLTCRMCLEALGKPVLRLQPESARWRCTRIKAEMRSLLRDPPYGIRADTVERDSFSHFQAAICGPPGSPYEGGQFFLYVRVPWNYPMRPPVVRFLTRIFHPNVSAHGDVGVDCILHNWTLALTLAKVLLSVQSLLTDPYTHVCMEPAVGLLYRENRPEFERVARQWTRKYAMHDYFPPAMVQALQVADLFV